MITESITLWNNYFSQIVIFDEKILNIILYKACNLILQ